MYPHHREAIDAAKERLMAEADVVAILIAGSIARKVERADSDVDLIVVVTDNGWQQRSEQSAVAFLWTDLCDYEHGYVEGRFVSETFIREAAIRGSEPTRHSFTGVYPVYCTNPAIESALPKIPVYPEQERSKRIASFMAQLRLNKSFFWAEGIRQNDPYLKGRAASEIVLFGGRLILAHNQILFPCQKRLMEYVAAAPQKPDHFLLLANNLMTCLTEQDKDAFCQAVEGFTDWGIDQDLLSLFLQDVEMSWFTRTPAISEW